MESANPEGAASRARERTAYTLKTRYQWLNSFSDDELRDIAVCYEGESLNAGEQYFDLSHPERGVVKGRPGETVPEGSCFVAISEVTPDAWHKLITIG